MVNKKKHNLIQGWTSDPGRDAQLEYRLSIYHATPNDTGTYVCSTPSMKYHAMRIVVEDVRDNYDTKLKSVRQTTFWIRSSAPSWWPPRG